jgi:nucleoside-diphosphate-sugar epimerase
MELVGLRYFNVFGPRQDPYGAYAAVIPLFAKAMIRGQQPQINGDGSQTRDVTFVENVVQANIKALFSTHPEAVNHILNVGIDANHLNPLLLKRVDHVINKLEDSIAAVIEMGIQSKEIREDIEPSKYARLFFSKLEGAIFMAVIRKNEQYMKEITDHIDYTIDIELKR